MKTIAVIISVICLALTLLPSFFVYAGAITLDTSKSLMIAGTIGWFISASFWMNRKQKNERTAGEQAEYKS